MNEGEIPLRSIANLAPEDQARANLYALLARLFYAPPDAGLLAAIVAEEELAPEEADNALAGAWGELKRAAEAAAQRADLEALADEYNTVFVGTGRAEATPYVSAYLARTTADMPLVDVRDFLAAHRIVRRAMVNEPEDHIALLCETMRYLIFHEGSLPTQRELFERFIWPAIDGLCNAIGDAEHADFYIRVARLARAYCEIEHTSFVMHYNS
jgi:TorA maturation chaperone TorD